MAHADTRPIIKRKKVVVEAGHHGGAWKVAYADFVTAMMAFFLMMWLLNSTTEEQRQGLADYFSPGVPVSQVSGGADGALGGGDPMMAESLVGSATSLGSASDTDEAPEDSGALQQVVEELTANSGESTVADHLLRHINVRVTDEGVIVELFDIPGEPLFEAGSARPTMLMRDLAGVVGRSFNIARNSVAVNGHVVSEPLVRQDRPVWSLSSARADETRRLLERDVVPARIKRVAGYADREPIHLNRMDVRNNRIELILLRNGVR